LLVSLCGIAGDATGADLSGLGMDADDAIILASELPDKGALSKLSLKDNALCTKEAGKALAAALAGNSVLKELDLSNNSFYNSRDDQSDGPGFAQELAIGIKDNGAMSILDICSNYIRAEGGKALAAGLKGNQVIKELNFSGNTLGYNSNLDTDTSGIIAIADVIPGMGALSVLSLKDNRLLTKDGGKALAQALANNSTLKELDVSSNNWMEYGNCGKLMGDGPGFAQELAVGIKDNGALTKLNARSNNPGDDGADALKKAAGSR
jgi:Ran GTPase-activating protein (RanGAP) involved in mRNA processing and transport